MKYGILFGAFILGCVAASTQVMAGNCHGKKAPAVVVEQDVVVEPGVEVKETVEVDAPGPVTVIEKVEIGKPAGAPLGVPATRRDAWKAFRATVAEAKAERRAAYFAKRAYNAEQEAAADEAVKNIYSH